MVNLKRDVPPECFISNIDIVNQRDSQIVFWMKKIGGIL